jgi:hypothetical protein
MSGGASFSAGSQTVATSGSQAGTPVVTLFISDGVE